MLLAIDIGNSNIVFGVFEDDKLISQLRVVTKKDGVVQDWLKIFKDFSDINAIAVSSVVPELDPVIATACERHFKKSPFFITHKIKLPIQITLDHPEAVGADLLVTASAAYVAKKTDLLIVDLGTATTFVVVDANGRFLGGSIAPGMKLSLQALCQEAAKLPHIELEKPKSVIGKNTVDSMQSGIYYGYAGLVDGIVRATEREFGRPLTVIATGGLAPFVAAVSKTIQEVDPDLMLKGLKLLYEMNA